MRWQSHDQLNEWIHKNPCLKRIHSRPDCPCNSHCLVVVGFPSESPCACAFAVQPACVKRLDEAVKKWWQGWLKVGPQDWHLRFVQFRQTFNKFKVSIGLQFPHSCFIFSCQFFYNLSGNHHGLCAALISQALVTGIGAGQLVRRECICTVL